MAAKKKPAKKPFAKKTGKKPLAKKSGKKPLAKKSGKKPLLAKKSGKKPLASAKKPLGKKAKKATKALAKKAVTKKAVAGAKKAAKTVAKKAVPVAKAPVAKTAAPVAKTAAPVAKRAAPVAKSKRTAADDEAAKTRKVEVLADDLESDRRGLGEGTRLPNVGHHQVSLRQMDQIAHEGLRSDGEILHVEESELSPCRLVDHGEDRFSLCLDDFKMPQVPLFEERGLQGGGYTWEAVVESLVKMRRPELLQDLTFDSEAGMFVALGGRETLRVVAKLIQEAIGQPAVLLEAVNRADPDRLE